MFGPACYPPPNATILNPVWGTWIKLNGTRRRRLCGNGSPKAAPRLHLEKANNSASSLEHAIFRLFVALCTAENFLLFSGDATDAFALLGHKGKSHSGSRVHSSSIGLKSWSDRFSGHFL